jgi:hypothetical protein
MKGSRLLALVCCLAATLGAQTAAPPQTTPSAPVSLASVSETNAVLTQVEQVAQALAADLGHLRIEKWKTDADYKRQSLANVESLLRNLQGALPGMVAELRGAPEDLNATFKLYRNLGALYDVLSNVAESAGAFGPKDDYQSLANDASLLDRARRALADRMENLSTAKDKELVDLRNQVRALKAAIPTEPPKKILVDSQENPKKPAPAKKKTAKPTAAQPGATQAPATTKKPADIPVQPPPKPQ